MTDIAKLGFSVDTRGLQKGEKELDKFAKSGQEAEKKISKSSDGISSSFKSIAGSIGLTAAALAGLTKTISVAREFDILNAQLITATGSAEKATIAFQGIQDFASKTPFDLAQVTDSFVKLTNLGLSPSERAITSYGNTASAMGKDLNQLIEAVADAATGEFERLKEFGIKTRQEGENVSFTFRGMTTTVKKEAEAIEGFLIGLGENEFAGAMQERVNTLDGALSNLGDSWDKLSLNISKLGIGSSVEEAVRVGISALDEMSAFLESGQLEASLNLISMKFSAFTKPLEDGVKEVTEFILMATNIWGEDISEFGRFFSLAFKNLPENVKSVIQLIGIEISSLATFAQEYGSAFGEILGVKFGLIIEEAKVYGQAIGAAVNFFESEDFDLEANLERVRNVAVNMSDEIIKRAEENAERATQIRRDSIELILIERDLSIASSDAQIQKINELGETYRKLQEDRKKSNVDALAQFGIKPETADEVSKITKKQMKEMEKLTNEVNKFGGAWSKSGSIIIDTFGDIADSLDDYMSRIEDIEELEKRLAIKRKEFGEDNAQVMALEMKLNDERVSAELSGISSLARAGEKLFDEKTAAAKSFAALQKIITVAEIALSFQKIAASNAETATTVANETTKAGANGLSAITAAFAAPWPIGFVAGAAMTAIIANLLGGSSGGSASVDPTQTRQDTQGTGTILGDSGAKSQSLLNAQERFNEIQIDQLAELRGIQSSLNSLESGISFAVKNLISTPNLGEFTGDLGGGGSSFVNALIDSLFSKTERKVIDSGIQFVAQSLGDILSGGIVQASQFFDILKTKKRLFGLISSTSTSTEFESLDRSFGQAIAGIFRNIGDTVLEAASILGFESVDVLVQTITRGFNTGTFQEDIFEFTRNFEDFFETSFETVTVGLEERLAQFVIDIGQVSLEGLSSEEIQAELEAVISQQADLIAEFLVPSIKEYQQVGEGLFDTLLRVAHEQVIFIDQIEKLGFSLSHLSNVIQIDVAQSVIQLIGGLEEFNSLSQSFFENFFSEAEQMAALERSLEEAFESLGLSMVDSREEFRALVEGIDLTTEEGQALFAALMQINPALDDYIDRLDDSRKALEDSARDSFDMLERSIELEKERARTILEAARVAHEAEISRLDDLRNQLETEHDLRLSNLDEAERALQSAMDAEIDRIQSVANERIKSLNDERAMIVSNASVMRSLITNINRSIGLAGSLDLVSALSGARAGDFTQAQRLDVNKLANLDPKDFSSATELAIQQAINRGRLATISALASEELSEAERMIASIDAQTAAISEDANAQIAALESQRDELLGIQTNVLTVKEAIDNFKEAQLELESLNYEGEIEKLDMLVASANEVFELHQQAYNDEITRLDSILANFEHVLNVALGIDNSVLSVKDAIDQVNHTIALLRGPIDIPIKEPEIIFPPPPPAPPPLKEEINNAIIENRQLLNELVRTSRTSANALQQFSLNGMDTRVIE